MNHEASAYGLWGLVLVNTLLFSAFAFSFFKPKTKRDWRTFGTFSGFLLALFVEMYGFPLTIYLLSGWIGRRFPALDPLSHDAGHLWYTLLGFEGNPHANPIHVASNVFIFLGFLLLALAWPMLYRAQRKRALAVAGPYQYIRHPQYLGFILVMFGFLLQWPTLVTVVTFPILLVVYVRLAHREEAEVHQEFGRAWESYATATPRWFPRLRRTQGPAAMRAGSS
jgi:protein-S-isoprenylcysteine O-methyltransferase Ste14